MAPDVFYPAAGTASKAHCSSMQQYRQMHARSLEQPEQFWGQIAEQFHWEAPTKGKFFEFNFDIRKGPVFVRWMHQASTNICYNL
ncbi:Hypothetical predicted protein, partial [Cloeon dipterum]